MESVLVSELELELELEAMPKIDWVLVSEGDWGEAIAVARCKLEPMKSGVLFVESGGRLIIESDAVTVAEAVGVELGSEVGGISFVEAVILAISDESEVSIPIASVAASDSDSATDEPSIADSGGSAVVAAVGVAAEADSVGDGSVAGCSAGSLPDSFPDSVAVSVGASAEVCWAGVSVFDVVSAAAAI